MIILYSRFIVPPLSTLELQDFAFSYIWAGGNEPFLFKKSRRFLFFPIKCFTGSYHCLFHTRLLVHSLNVINPFNEG